MRKYYLITLTFLLVALSGNLWAQRQTVTGTVTDGGSGTPLPGVTVLEKGTNNGTTTDFDGNYGIELPQGATLVGIPTKNVTVFIKPLY